MNTYIHKTTGAKLVEQADGDYIATKDNGKFHAALAADLVDYFLSADPNWQLQPTESGEDGIRERALEYLEQWNNNKNDPRPLEELIADFTRSELQRLENSIWDEARKENAKLEEELDRHIENTKKIRIEAEQMMDKYREKLKSLEERSPVQWPTDEEKKKEIEKHVGVGDHWDAGFETGFEMCWFWLRFEVFTGPQVSTGNKLYEAVPVDEFDFPHPFEQNTFSVLSNGFRIPDKAVRLLDGSWQEYGTQFPLTVTHVLREVPAGTVQGNGGWISIEDRKPEGHILCLTFDGSNQSERHWKGNHFEGEHIATEPKVTHWRLPIPNPDANAVQVDSGVNPDNQKNK